MISYILAVVLGGIVLAVDQYTKFLIMNTFEYQQSADFIKGLIRICYIHNTGGAWGVLEGHTWVLLAMTIAIMVVCVVLLVKWGAKNKLLFFAMTLVLSGGVGNLIDRVFRGGNVVDFLQFDFWQEFPVFNVADCAIVIGVGLLMLYFLLDTVKELKAKKLADTVKVTDDENNSKD